MTTGGPERDQPRGLRTARPEAFSDGVFAAPARVTFVERRIPARRHGIKRA
jgi:hypothetical protein